MKKIIVYILTTKSIEYDVFKSRRYIIKYITLNYQSETEYLNEKDNNELTRVMEALRRCQEHYSEHYCIILKDSSISCLNKEILSTILKETINIDDWDICYLCRWLDDCKRCQMVKECDQIKIIETFSPHGIQSLMFSPIGRRRLLNIEVLRNGEYFSPVTICLDIYLNKLIGKRALKALAYSPNIFSFDPTKIRNDADTLKLSLCRIIPQHEFQGVYPISYYISIVGLAALLLVAFHQIRRASS